MAKYYLRVGLKEDLLNYDIVTVTSTKIMFFIKTAQQTTLLTVFTRWDHHNLSTFSTCEK
jgi:hypothetical protein